MKLIDSKIENISQTDFSLQGIYKQIEKAGRTCYKSEDKITDDSAESFVKMLLDRGHYAMLEHGIVHLKFPFMSDRAKKYELDPYSDISHISVADDDEEPEYNSYVTTNFRVIVGNGWQSDLEEFLDTDNIEMYEPVYSYRITCDRGVSHELVRHRVFSFAQESTRYCNYSKDKFNKQLTFIKPYWLNESNATDYMKKLFLEHCRESEALYMCYINNGMKPQEARAILPNALKTEIVVTGFRRNFVRMLSLRNTTAAHPDMQIIAKMINDDIRK